MSSQDELAESFLKEPTREGEHIRMDVNADGNVSWTNSRGGIVISGILKSETLRSLAVLTAQRGHDSPGPAGPRGYRGKQGGDEGDAVASA